MTMTRTPDLDWFYDTEFLDDGERVHLISIGIMPGPTVDQTPFYAVNADAPWIDIVQNQWLRTNVWPHLPRTRVESGDAVLERLDTEHSAVLPHARIGPAIVKYLARYSDRRARHALWAYYSAYDHVALAQLFGPMISLPDTIPMWTHDLMQLWERHDYHPAMRPAQDGSAIHDALADARWNREFFDRMARCEGACGAHTGALT